MKRFLIAVVALTVSVAASFPAYGQAQINTKKVKIEDFMEKTMKVVTSGNMFFDRCLKDEVTARWRISPFEFCSLDEFEKLKTDENYYFMIVTSGRFRKEAEPGISFISVLKGGKKAESGLDSMLEVVSAPIMSAKNPNGREFIFLPAILDAMQQHIAVSMENDMAGYGGLSNSISNLSEVTKYSIVFATEDLSCDIDEKARQAYTKKGIFFVEADDADEVMAQGRPETLVSYTVTPDNAGPGSFCYKMLIDTRTHKLYYFRKHRISKRLGPGFLLEDMNRIVTR